MKNRFSRCRLGLAAVIVLAGFCATPVRAGALRPTAHITTQTTTTLVTGVSGQTVTFYSGSLCVDGNGATTGITLQDSAATNLIGSGIVYVLTAGQCLTFPTRGDPYGVPTGSGNGLQVVTTVGNGPVEVYLEVIQR